MSNIVVAGRLGAPIILQTIVEGLRNLGHGVAYHEDAAAFQRAGASLAETDIVIAAPGFPCTKALMASAPSLRGVISPITGFDNIDSEAATELGIIVANGQVPENTESMAEATILLMLAALYDMHGTEAVLRHNLPRPVRMKARMLQGKTVGVIGYGQIAQAVVARLAGWNVNILAHARRARADTDTVRFVGLEELLTASDIVCVLTNLHAGSRGLLNGERLRLLKQGAVLVNTARGAIIDEAALIEVARERPDLLLALDTFTVEPLPPDSPLRDIPNAILTPHMLGHTQESADALPPAAIENTQRILAGELPLYVCNPDVVERWQAHWPAVPHPGGRSANNPSPPALAGGEGGARCEATGG
jgi:D-3-phosphoglycerate dehydrogenase